MATLMLLTPGVARAEDPSSSLSSDAELKDFIQGSSQSPTSSGSSLDLTLRGLSLIGSSEIPIPDQFAPRDPNYPLDTDASITEAKLVEIKDTDRAGIKRWVVSSPSMKRNVSVYVQASKQAKPAPMLYLLDGIDAPAPPGLIGSGQVDRSLNDENVTVVMPAQARASMFYDWEQEDEALGLYKWETFLTQELPEVLENGPGISFNGKRAVGGVSMGASGALNLINRNPEVFDAAIGISGCYSNSDPIGEQTQNIIVSSRGGSVKNMVGEKGSAAWNAHDVAADVSALKDKTIYLSSGNGSLDAGDIESYKNNSPAEVAAGVVLEQGAHYCTQRLADELAAEGAENVKVHQIENGGHNWRTFRPNIRAGWDYIKPALES
ncbi:alpha/beta hydrolase [Corynebacterium flavescens]